MSDAARWPEAVLSRRLVDAVRGRKLRSAVFTTFNFDPGFFELQVLPLLFPQSFSQVDKVRLLQLEDALRDVDHVAVYYDRGALSQDAEPARLDYRRIDVRRRTGVFHPKQALLLVEEPNEPASGADTTRQALVVACLSANLSRAGWWENVECAHVEVLQDRSRAPGPVSYRRDLLAIVRRTRACAAQDDDHRALNAVHVFLRRRLASPGDNQARSRGRWRTRLFGGERRLPLASWLASLGLGGHDWNLEVISPYFDARGAGPLKDLVEAVRPRETRVYLPRDADGAALATAAAYKTAAALDGVRWAKLPNQVTQRSGGASGERLAPRRVHAKVYRLWRQGGGEIVLAGSVNCTSAAHGHGGAGNLEAAFLVDVSDGRPHRSWWLAPLDCDPDCFADAVPDEADGLDRPPFGVSVRYHWGHRTLATRIDRRSALPIEVTDVSGRSLFTVEHDEAGQWITCSAKAAAAVCASLRSSSFLVMRCGDAQWRVLVREEGMAYRPSIWNELKPDEILEYWSLLSDDERAAFIERHAAIGEQFEGIAASASESLADGDTLFDRFAGIFHAFGCLRRSVERREQRRELLSAMARLGAPYIDLYLLAISLIGSFSLGQRQETENAADLAAQFVRLLERQADEPGFHAFHELSQAAEAFDHILAVNFPEAPSCALPELARLYGVTLQKQVPVGRMSGGVNQRLVRQFRMPGFPLVLITTDVLQEGEDLHTFCRRVVHYGMAWTPSAIEQRTGRVDRIGGLVQRRLDGSLGPVAPDELIQVYYPHLRDTVELLQVRRVLLRLNRFLRLIHRGDRADEANDKAIDASRALLEETEDLPPIEGKLESAFPIESQWLNGELGARHVIPTDWNQLHGHLDALWQELCERYPIIESTSGEPHLRRGEFHPVQAGGRIQPFTLGLRSQVAGAEILIECESTIGVVDLQDDEVIKTLSKIAGNGSVKLCVDPRVGKHQDRVYVRREVLFDSDATRLDDVAAMFESTLLPAVRLHADLESANLLGAIVD